METEVIEYTKLLVRNEQFAQDIQAQIGQKMDNSEIEAEIEGCCKRLKKLERSKANLERDIDNISDDDKRAERKRNDMNNRLNKIYEEIYDIEDQITECEKKKSAVEQSEFTKENIYKMLLVFDRLFDKMDEADKRKVLESLIAEVHLYPKDTWDESRNPVKEIKYTFPISREAIASLGENQASVETIVLLSKGEVDSKKIRVEFSLEDMDMSEFQDGATYPQIKEYVLEHTGLKVSNLYISQIKRKCGIEVGKNYNLPKAEDSRQPQCPPEKEKAIREAFKYFGMI